MRSPFLTAMLLTLEGVAEVLGTVSLLLQSCVSLCWIATWTPSPVYGGGLVVESPGIVGSRVTAPSMVTVPSNGASQRRMVSWSGDSWRRLFSRSVICWLCGIDVDVTLIGTCVLALEVSNVGVGGVVLVSR